MSNPIMCDEDEAAALAAELRRRTAERDQLATLGAELRARLAQAPEMREVVGALRRLKQLLDADTWASREAADRHLRDLLRRLDLESQ